MERVHDPVRKGQLIEVGNHAEMGLGQEADPSRAEGKDEKRDFFQKFVNWEDFYPSQRPMVQ